MNCSAVNFCSASLPTFFGVLALGATFFPSAYAEQLPQWEAGVGVAGIDFPQYRGSNERSAYVLPVPYFIYRGDVLKVDRQRMRSLFFHNDQMELDVSVNGSVPVKDNTARRGMPNLDPTLEIGPTLNFRLYESESNEAQLELRLPVRTVLATDFSYMHDVGWMFQPKLNLNMDNVLNKKGWSLGMSLGSIFTDRRYNQYFYGVEPRYANPDRPAYAAGSGYAGSQFVFSLSHRLPKMWVSGFIKWDSLRGAAFEASPLVKNKEGATAGFVVTWVLSESTTKVEYDE